jgi:hypothetical protein
MTTNGRFSQTPPDKANELFDKLLATSDAAVKIRERLFTALKDELELLATLQEEHLFPVLTRHGMQDLVREASSDNRETGSLLAELERMPKNSAEFISKVGDLKRVFQQHLRDDKKELLPAVLKVLSDEEASAVVEKVEDEMADIDESKRAEVRRARKQVETDQRVTEDVANTVKAGVEGAQTVVRAMQGAVAQSGTAVARGLQDVSLEVFERSQQRLQRNLDGLQALARCRTMTDLVEVQRSLLRDNLEQTVENSRRIAELTIQMADEAARTMTVQAEKTAHRVNRAA